ncbi:MAG: hypothetical protein RBQ97_08265 [Acholeplasma sp.]|jgi:hypothetical protein|uniref:hypothetical protein n=1 Tax=unclassified Acetobacterium TaxID=2638182 RepID=UPI000DBEB4DB|nr:MULTISPECIES: hypothetical protein [unclassified Acetobacterium]AWW25777.1 hypothetical protein DOZ58_03445 [Acetobacterium sp. KB-1]MDY0278064.1 hypothetical protein [Acholeplasma sp.]MDZ5726610.1 hypothetical protein [Acetobacterium sp. K1/6]
MFEKQYMLKGKHATYAKFLSLTTLKKNKDAKIAGVFRANIDIYLVAPLIGVNFNLKSEEDTISNDELAIFAEQLISQQDNLINVFRLVMLSENSSNLSDDERIERAFKEDEDSEKLAANMELFHKYMRGGIEWLYDQFTEEASTKDDYLAKILKVTQTYKLETFM